MTTVGVVSRGGQVPHVRLPRPPSSSSWTRPTVDGRPPGPGGQRPVCRFWLQGCCTRRPCPFLHSCGPRLTPVIQPRPNPTQQQQPRRRSPPRSRVWTNPNLVPMPSTGDSPNLGQEDRKKGTVTPGGGERETPVCPRPPTPTPLGGEGGCTPGGGERETLVCPRPLTPPPHGHDGGDDKPSIVLLRQETVECQAPPPTPLSRDDDGGYCSDCPSDDTTSNKIVGGDSVESELPSITPSDQDEDVGDDNDRPSLGHPSCFSLLTALGVGDGSGHQQAVTGITLPSGSDKMFSGSTDGTVRVWDCGSGKCTQVIEFGGPVTCVISDGPWIFVGTHSSVNVCNTLMRTGLSLPGPSGPVYSLTTSDDVLFAGVSDGSILAWKVSLEPAPGGGDGVCFRFVSSLGGHTSAVISMAVGKSRLYSGSVDCTIRVWDVETLQCCHTLSAHDDSVTSLLCWLDFLLSCSLDGTIKVWGTMFPKEGEGEGDDGGGGGLGLEVVYTQHEEHGVLLLNGVCDPEGRPVLMCSLGDDRVHLYDLPSFSDRGRITCRKGEVTAMHTGPRGLFFFTGDVTGEVSVWRWSQN